MKTFLEIDFCSLFDWSGLTLMMSLTPTDAVTSLSVCHHFPGSSRVHLCSRPQGTEGLPALTLGVSTINLSVTYIQFILDLIELRLTCFPRAPQVWWVLKGWLGSQGRLDIQAHQELESQAYQLVCFLIKELRKIKKPVCTYWMVSFH